MNTQSITLSDADFKRIYRQNVARWRSSRNMGAMNGILDMKDVIQEAFIQFYNDYKSGKIGFSDIHKATNSFGKYIHFSLMNTKSGKNKVFQVKDEKTGEKKLKPVMSMFHRIEGEAESVASFFESKGICADSNYEFDHDIKAAVQDLETNKNFENFRLVALYDWGPDQLANKLNTSKHFAKKQLAEEKKAFLIKHKLLW